MPYLLISIVLGIICNYLGYQIYYKKKFDFINDFLEKKRQGVIGEDYAMKIGKIFLFIGNLFFLAAFVLFFFKLVKFLLAVIVIIVVVTIALLISNAIKNKR